MLIAGESGTGKELVARLIHTLDSREHKGALVVIDCTTIVPDLSGSEFFGHEKGAYTGAWGARDGAFALADGGTLFLDEVGDLPPRLQAELLRVVQEGTYKRVGGNTWHKTAFRLICASHRDLERDVSQDKFRRDLFYRLAGWRCTLPPLRDRQEDIPSLVHHFLKGHFADEDSPTVAPALLNWLVSRDYPGNVRELRHLVARIVARHVGDGPITVGALPEEERPKRGRLDLDDGAASSVSELIERAARLALLRGMGLKEIGDLAANTAVRIALQPDGNVRRAAERLGVSKRAVQLRQASWRELGLGNGHYAPNASANQGSARADSKAKVEDPGG